MAVRPPPSVLEEMRTMDATMIEEHFENIDRRLTRLEQILPTLATKDDLKSLATREELKTLATKEELRAAIAPLATKDELKTLATKEELGSAVALLATKDDLGELRRHMEVLTESLRGDIHLIAAHVASARPKASES
jgi:hypothetical protein